MLNGRAVSVSSGRGSGWVHLGMKGIFKPVPRSAIDLSG
jgi:hypothetical protein